MKLSNKMRKGMVFIALFILNSIIVQAAFLDSFSGIFAGIRNFFHLEVIGSALLIGAAAYFALPLFGQKLETRPGQTAALLIIALVSIIIVIQPLRGTTYSPDTYTAIWEKEAIVKLFHVLVGQKDANIYIDNGDVNLAGRGRPVNGYINEDGEPRVALLSADGIIILVAGTILFAWFFNFLHVAEGNNQLNYALAIVIAADLAVHGYTTDALIKIGVLFAFFIFAKGINATVKTTQYAYAMSGILVLWIHKILTGRWNPFWGGGAESGGVKEVGWWASITGTFSDVAFWALIIVIFLVAVTWKKGADGEGRFKKIFKSDPWKYGVQKIWAFLRGKWLLQMLGLSSLETFRDKSAEGELPFIFRDLRVELETLMNYMLRLEVYTAKHMSVKYGIETMKTEVNQLLGQTNYLGHMKRDMDLYKNGTGYKQNSDGFFEQSYRKLEWEERPGQRKSKVEANQVGFLSTLWLVYEFIFNEFKKSVEAQDFTADPGNVEDKARKGSEEIIENKVKPQIAILEGARGRVMREMEKMGGVYRRESLMKAMLDQYLHCGKYQHYYRFAKPKAKIWRYKAKPDKNRIIKYGKREPTNKEVAEKTWLTEVDLNGKFIEDINTVLIDQNKELANFKGSPLGYVRGVDIKDIYIPVQEEDMLKDDTVGYQQILEWLNIEWLGFIRDVMDGRYHPMSKPVSYYTSAHSKGNWKYRKYNTLKQFLKREAPSIGAPGSSDPAFDREALKDPGNFVYWGRKRYHDSEESINSKPLNPYPTVTALGLKLYIQDIAEKIEEDIQKAQLYLEQFVYATGKEGAEEGGVFTETPKGGETKQS